MTRETLPLTNFEYAILTDTWSFGVRGAAYNAAYEFCKDCGYLKDSANHRGYKVTSLGVDAIKHYQAQKSFRRGEAI